MIRQSFILLVLIATCCSAVFSQSCYEIKSDFPIQPLDSYLLILEDSTKLQTVDEILNDTVLPFHRIVPQPALLEKNSAYWAKFCLISPIDTRYILYFNDPMKGGPGWGQGNGRVDLYRIKDRQIERHQKSGTRYPASEKDMAKDWNVNQFSIELKANKPAHFLVRIEGNQFDFRPYFNMQLHSLDHSQNGRYPLRFLSFSSIILGMLLICLIYYFALFLFSRKQVYGWFAVWLFVTFLSASMVHPQSLITKNLLFNIPQSTLYLWALSSSAVWILFWLFGRDFVESKKLYPKLDRTILILVVIIAVYIIVFQVYDILVSVARAPVFNQLFYGIMAVTRFIGVVIAVILIFKPSKIARYFGVGAVLANLTPILGALHYQDIIHLPADPYLSSIALQVIIYSIGLAYRQRLQDKAFQDAQLQLVSNEKIKAEARRMKDLDEMKSRFFANISHEFRTPLSLILGPLNQSIESVPASEVISGENEIPVKGRHLHVMKKNAQRLLQLVDQILDLSKVEAGNMQLRLEEGDVIQFIRAIVFSFESLAERRHIHFKTHFGKIEGVIYFDRDKLEKIIVNLLSNAFKFTPEHGDVMVSVEGSGARLKLIVADTGQGMTTEDAAKIFDRFYQTESSLDQGTGIGLALVKELVGVLNGHISVESHENKGTKFTVTVPCRREDFSSSAILIEPAQPASQINTVSSNHSFDTTETHFSTDENNDLPLLLIVEDNPDLAQYIGEQFKGQYNVIHAMDGSHGWLDAQAKLPDLIISDVMMPGMNGMDLCHKIKTDVKTSHIPVILLTAKADLAAKIKGLETGADDYLTKPFEGRELQVRVKNLIKQRQELRQLYSDHIINPSSNKVLSSMDEKFMKQVMNTIEDNIDNEYFTVEDLANEVSFSRSQLNRKIKGLTDKTTNQLIREWRLTQAHELLKHQAATVTEIAYQVGYSNLSYFAKSYKELFGYLPSETVK